jgi:hypothetical protein
MGSPFNGLLNYSEWMEGQGPGDVLSLRPGQKKSPPEEFFASEALALEYKKNAQDEDGDQ